MPISHVTPERTCAVVVGIEQYAIDVHWNLDGPASDAARFVDWLCAKGVPPGNILVLLAPLEDNRHLGEELTARGIPTLAASHDQIVSALADRLPGLDGELLLLFWGGHGVITSDHKRRLFCANATLNNQQVIGLEDLLVMLRSKTCGRFKRQIAVIDACANYFEEMRSKVSLAESGFSRGEPDADVQQYVLYGAATGELARNNSVRKTGAFSEVVLETLCQDPHWPPDINGLLTKVKGHFERLRREGKARQTPVYFQWQWQDEGEGTLGDLPVSGEVQSAVREVGLAAPQLRKLAKAILACPGLADNNQWGVLHSKLPADLKAKFPLAAETADWETELVHFFASVWKEKESLEEWLAAFQEVEKTRAVFQAVEDKIECLREVNEVRRRLGDVMITTPELRQLYGRSAPDPQLAPEADDLDQVLENLWDMVPRTGGGISPLLEFVERVAQRYSRQDLSDLVKETASSPQQVADLEAYLKREKIADTASTYEYLLIDIPSTSSPLEYWFHSWNRECDIHQTIEEVVSVPLSSVKLEEDIQGKIEQKLSVGNKNICTALGDILDNIGSIRRGELFIELFVPLEMLSCEADQWKMEWYGKFKTRLGISYPVSLRWRDRAQNKRGTRSSEWREVTRKIRERESSGMPLTVYWVELDRLTAEELMSHIGLGNYGEFVSFLFIPVDLDATQVSEPLMVALLGGAPFAFWARENPSDWQNFKKHMQDELLDAGRLDYVPCKLKDLRSRAPNPSHPDYALTLFWDDPDRNPLAAQYPTTIPQRGAS